MVICLTPTIQAAAAITWYLKIQSISPQGFQRGRAGARTRGVVYFTQCTLHSVLQGFASSRQASRSLFITISALPGTSLVERWRGEIENREIRRQIKSTFLGQKNNNNAFFREKAGSFEPSAPNTKHYMKLVRTYARQTPSSDLAASRQQQYRYHNHALD